MAIVEMKRIALLASKADEKKLLKEMQRMGCVHLTSGEAAEGFAGLENAGELARENDKVQRLRWAIEKLQRYDHTKKPLFADLPVLSPDDSDALLKEKQDTLMQAVGDLESLEQKSGELRGQKARADGLLEQLTPWKNLDVSKATLSSCKCVTALTGTMPTNALSMMEQPDALFSIEALGTERDLTYVCVLIHTEVAEETLKLLKDNGFVAVQLPQFNGTVAEEIDRIHQEMSEIDKQQQALAEQTAEYAVHLQDMKFLHDSIKSRAECLDAEQMLLHSESTFYLNGFVPASAAESIEKKVKELSPSCCIEISDPAPDDDVPVLLKNSPVVTPYESVVSGFSLPDYHGLDPTAVMMAFFANFMGMMVSDAGYGLLMVIFIPIILKLFKPGRGTRGTMWILFGGGIATVIWGALYNTWFGFSISGFAAPFDPVNEALPVMGVCVGVGAVHLFTGLALGAYMNIKRGKPLDAIFDQLSWFLLVMGIILLVLPMFVPNLPEKVGSIAKYLALAGALIILVSAGREKSKNPIKRLISGLGALYSVTSWVSDLLSYMRLFGMGLATGVIGMVFNQLVGMVFSIGPIGYVLGSVLFVFCHLFNMAINVLGAYVHSCRLQYIEFFGKFYEEGGKPFTPLAASGRYCYIQDHN